MVLREVREMKQMTQQNLADAIGKDRSLITKIENGDTLPSVETAKAIGRILEIDWTIFFKGIGEKLSQNTTEEE